MTHVTCPHCGVRFTFDGEVERHDVNGEPCYFLPLAPGQERHIDQRLACPKCYERAGAVRLVGDPADPPHPYGTRYHSEVRLAHPVGTQPFGYVNKE